MRGLHGHEQEPPKSLKFFKLIQETAKNEGKVFFADSGEGRDIITNEFEGMDFSGWLVPAHLADEFEPVWDIRQGDMPDRWDEFWVWAEWEMKDGEVVIKFDPVEVPEWAKSGE